MRFIIENMLRRKRGYFWSATKAEGEEVDPEPDVDPDPDVVIFPNFDELVLPISEICRLRGGAASTSAAV